MQPVVWRLVICSTADGSPINGALIQTPKHQVVTKRRWSGLCSDRWLGCFAHQFSSIAGAGPVTGAIQAAVFGWVPVFLWIILGGIFFGAVTDFGALYASVKNEGKSMGLLIEQYIGKTGKKLFLLFCWLFTLIVTAAFADMVAGTFNAYETVDGVTSLSRRRNCQRRSRKHFPSVHAFAVVFGLIQKKLQFHGWKQTMLGLVCTVAAFVIGMNCPLLPPRRTGPTWYLPTFSSQPFFLCGF